MGNHFMDNRDGLERFSGNYDFVFNPAVSAYLAYSKKIHKRMAWKVAYFIVTCLGIPGVLITMLADIGVFAMSNWKVNIFFILSSIGVGLRMYWYHRDKKQNARLKDLEIELKKRQMEINNDEILPHQ